MLGSKLMFEFSYKIAIWNRHFTKEKTKQIKTKRRNQIAYSAGSQ